MVTVTKELAERIADVARLLSDDDGTPAPLRQLTELAVELIPGSSAAGIVAAGETSLTFAASDPSIGELHRLQFDSQHGPLVEALRYGEPRRIDDAASEPRWDTFCRQMSKAGFGSCLVLPLRTDREPGGAVALYGRDSHAFRGADHDIALLFAAQGGVAVHNAATYQNCRHMVDNLHAALGSRAVIEQAKGVLVAEFGYSPETAFERLSRLSQHTNRKVRDIAADLVEGRIERGQFRSEGS
jgi:GAF domain-containing protein